MHTISNEATGALLLDRAVRQIELSWDDGALCTVNLNSASCAISFYSLILEITKGVHLDEVFSRIDHWILSIVLIVDSRGGSKNLENN